MIRRNLALIRKSIKMNNFLKQFLPASIINESNSNNSQQKTTSDSSTPTLPTPPSTPTMSLKHKIEPVQPIIESTTPKLPAVNGAQPPPTLKNKFIQASRSLFNRPIIDASMQPTPAPSLKTQQATVLRQTSRLVFQTKFDELRFYLEEIRTHFEVVKENKNDSQCTLANTMYGLTTGYLLHLQECVRLNEKILENSLKYDYKHGDELKHYSGYRTLSATFEKCCLQTLAVVKNIHKQKHNFLFQYQFMTSSIKEYETWCLLIEKIHTLLWIANEMQEKSTDSLFIYQNQITTEIEEKLFGLASTNPEAFFGRTCAFQFCESLKLPLTGCVVALASYNESYSGVNAANQTNNDLVRKTAKSLFSSTKYMLNPELRAQKLSSIMKNADVDFCKAFWQLTETPIVQMGSDFITPGLPVAVVKTLEQVVLKVEKENSTETVDIHPPACRNSEPTPLNIRILSAELRQGMESLDKSIMENSNKKFTQKSPHLILHAHGGGFIAHSSKSHEIYLKPWCKDLHVPIVSIDYSLAPEHPFPKASEECFYAYAWCLKNKDLLGWTGERIICVGDSAGGVLVTNIVQRAILAGIRVPDALVPIYTPFLLSYSLSPSRLMSVMDPLLNLGILWRCLAAYCGIDFKSFDAASPHSLRKLIETNKANLNTKNSENSDIKQNSLINRISSGKASEVNSCFDSEEIKLIDDMPPLEEPTSSDELMEAKEKNLRDLYKMIGNSVYLIELLRNHQLPLNPHMSPLLSDDEMLKKMPKTYLIACNNDAFLDDNIEMARLLERKNIPHEFFMIDTGVPHGFLNMNTLCVETKEATDKVFRILEQIIQNDLKSTAMENE